MSAVTPTILSGGRSMDPAYDLVSIHVWNEVNRIPRAELRLVDGDSSKQRFAVSDAPFFVPGATVEIKLRYEGEADHSLFEGIIVRHGVEATAAGSLLVIGLKDASVKLTGARRSNVFRDKTDVAIMKVLLDESGVSAGTLEPTSAVHREMVQYQCSAWDFILSRADALGLLVTADHGAVSARKLTLAGPVAHRFDWGLSEIYDLDIEADADNPYGAVEALGWDRRKLAPTAPAKGRGAPAPPGDLDPAALAGAVGRSTCKLSHLVPVANDELQAWADATLGRSVLAMLRGRLSVRGAGDLRPLDVIEIAGVGKRFNGKTAVTGVHHRVDASGWRSDVQFGLSPEPFSRSADIQQPPAAGLLPAVRSLQIGIVADFEADPEKQLRVKVIVPAVDPTKSGAVWAQLASPDAGPGRGFFFRPEPGDEVVLGFFGDDPRCPVILGALFGSKNLPPTAMGMPEERNQRKGIVTKKGTTIGFVDGDQPSVFIETAAKNKLLLDDGGRLVTLSDQHGNSITLGEEGIVIKSAKDLRIEARGNVEIKGEKVDIL